MYLRYYFAILWTKPRIVDDNALIQPAISAQKEAETLNKRISKINEEIAELEEELETIQSDKEGKTAMDNTR